MFINALIIDVKNNLHNDFSDFGFESNLFYYKEYSYYFE